MTRDISGSIAEVVDYALSSQTYLLRLYLSGMTARSHKSIRNIDKVCRDQLNGKYNLEVIDLRQHPVLDGDEQIIATHKMIKLLPLNLKRVVGDLSDCDRVLFGMDIKRKADHFDAWVNQRRNPREQRAKFAK